MLSQIKAAKGSLFGKPKASPRAGDAAASSKAARGRFGKKGLRRTEEEEEEALSATARFGRPLASTPLAADAQGRQVPELLDELWRRRGWRSEGGAGHGAGGLRSAACLRVCACVP